MKHKNAPDPIPEDRRAWHPQRGVRRMDGELKPGWRWLAAGEAPPRARKLRKRGLVTGGIGVVDALRARTRTPSES